MPLSPSVQTSTMPSLPKAKKDGCVGGQNSWVIDTLVRDDVIVVDLFGKVKDGTFARVTTSATPSMRKQAQGWSLTAVSATWTAFTNCLIFQRSCAGVDPTGIANVTLTGINIPIRIAEATVLPGDVVLGRRGGGYLYSPTFRARSR